MSADDKDAVIRTLLEVAAEYSKWHGKLCDADVTVDLHFMDTLEELALDLLGVPSDSDTFCRDWCSHTFYKQAVGGDDVDGYIGAIKDAVKQWAKEGIVR
jgi:hypothetical protein